MGKTVTSAPKRKAPVRGRRKSTTANNKKGSSNFVNVFVPLFFILCILFSLGFLGFMGYRTVTASPFFDVKTVEIQGAQNVSKEDVEKVVRAEASKNGVWNSDLNEIRNNIEKIPYIKTATVSRILPDGFRIGLIERQPKVVVRIDGGNYWADEDGVIVREVGKNEERPPFYMNGWDRNRTDNAVANNKERVRLYQKMLEEWQQYDLAKRVESVDLTDLNSPKAIIQDSGAAVKISLGKENFNERLQKGIKAVAGKGAENEAVDFFDQNIIITPRKNM